MPFASNSLPTDIQTLQRLVVLQQSAIDERDEQLAQFRRLNADTHSELERKKVEALHLRVWIEKLELQIARLKRMQFGRSSERLTHIEQAARRSNRRSRPRPCRGRRRRASRCRSTCRARRCCTNPNRAARVAARR